MGNKRYIFTYLALLAIQIVVGNYLNLTQYAVLIWLPVMIMSLPVTFSTLAVLLVSFATGLAADFFTHGVLGLSVIPLLVVGYARNFIIRLVFGTELLSRKEDISTHKQGIGKVSLSTFIATALFFLIYIPIDAAGTRSLAFLLVRGAISISASTAVSIYLSGVLAPREADRWK